MKKISIYIIVVLSVIFVRQETLAKKICSIYIPDTNIDELYNEMVYHMKNEIRNISDVDLVFNKNEAKYVINCRLYRMPGHINPIFMGCVISEENIDYIIFRTIVLNSKGFKDNKELKKSPEKVFEFMYIKVILGKDIKNVTKQYINGLNHNLFEAIRKQRSKRRNR
ncbi:MAG: hypothetical protein KMY53_12050 [Desulfarculus sp.]|nr:hypothetical protein [Pseudomonadota bacterium]MBV1738891.1 hypothetical protein [Desulfarculus sp.]